jgi:acyl dehydratase
MVDGFAALSGDASPIHMSDDAAQRHSFQRRVVHGMLLGSLVSGTLGMELPGERGVLEKMQLSFRNPCYVDDEITIDVAVAKFFASVQTLVLTVKITRADGTLLARGTAQAGLR